MRKGHQVKKRTDPKFTGKTHCECSVCYHHHHHHHHQHQMLLPLCIWDHFSFIHSFKYLQRFPVFPISGNDTKTHPVTGASFIPSSLTPLPLLPGVPTSPQPKQSMTILLLLLLNFLFSTYNHSSNSSCPHLPPGLLKQPPTTHPLSSLLSLQPVLHVAATAILHKLPSEDMVLLFCLQP